MNATHLLPAALAAAVLTFAPMSQAQVPATTPVGPSVPKPKDPVDADTPSQHVPMIAATTLGGTQHVVYRSVRGEVRHLFHDGRWRLGTAWPKGAAPRIEEHDRLLAFTHGQADGDRVQIFVQTAKRKVACFRLYESWRPWGPAEVDLQPFHVILDPNAQLQGFTVYRTNGPGASTWLTFGSQGALSRARLAGSLDSPGVFWNDATSALTAAGKPVAGWVYTAPSAPAGESAPAAWAFGSGEHVVYRGASGRLYELYSTDGAPNQWRDLMATTGAPANAVGDPVAYVFGNSQQVFYVGSDKHVHNLHWDGAWHHTDLTTSAGAPANVATANVFGVSAHPFWDTQHVFYRSTDQHLWELRWGRFDGWSAADLTSTAGVSASVSGRPVSYVLGNAQHVVFVGEDQHLYDVWSEGAWRVTDILGAARAH